MAVITDVSYYEDLMLEPLDSEVRVDAYPARAVQKGDVIDGHVVFDIKRGTKWADISDKDGKRIMRVLLNDDVIVERKFPTEESTERRSRANKNSRIARQLAEHKDRVQQALDNLNKHYAEHGYIRHWEIEPLVSAAAEEKVWRRFVAVVEYYNEKEDFDGDLVDVVEDFKDHLKEGLSAPYRHRSLSRSTSMMSNLMDDCDLEAEAEFVNKHWLW